MTRALLPLMSLWAVLTVGPALAWHQDWQSRVFRVEVTRMDGTRELGSAVPLAGERLVTNCHVLRNAARIEVQVDGNPRLAQTDLRDAYRDLCFLTLPGLDAPPMPMIELGETRVGLEVAAVGWPGGEFAVSRGRVIGLHACECDGGRVIQTSAPFDRGASGGGLFDHDGRLVGILTFKARSGGNFHFALPVGWLRQMAEARLDTLSPRQTFWEAPGKESGYFLTACDLGAKQDWRALQRLAEEWCEDEPNNPEAWMALGRALRGRDQSEQAASAFQKVLMLDSTHAEAKWALEQLEFDLGKSLMHTGTL